MPVLARDAVMPIKELSLTLSLFIVAQALTGADLPPDQGNTIPESSRRPVVIQTKASEADWKTPSAALPEGFSLITAAAAPLVTHPIMGCVDDQGRLFIGDAVGVNWNKEQLEKNPPNRILLLEDTDQDGRYDRSTVFADKMTFPQGAAWLDGSLYVCSPPGLWKLTDTDNDGVADQRKMIVGGFDYTGNAADVHGPKVHPNGRLYWAHGRKGHKVTDKDGGIIHEGSASGIWSCKPDGSDVQWHSLGCADNPTGLAFTPQGDIIGTCNLYYSGPRGDTLMHWLYGGVYERADQMKAIAGLTRTLDTMPVIHNFGHVAVSGCAFGPSETGNPLPLYVTHFNTQRLVRMDLTPDGATFRATENEFLKIHDPDVHLTDVIQDRDGSLIVLNTGGWFRIGCPSSLMAKPDMLGSVYRIRPKGTASKPSAIVEANWKPDWQLKSFKEILTQLQSQNPRALLQALSAASRSKPEDLPFHEALMKLLSRPLEPVLEHATLYAAITADHLGLEEVKAATDPVLLRRLLLIVSEQPEDAARANLNMGIAATHLDSSDTALARTALHIVTTHPDADEWIGPDLQSWLGKKELTAAQLKALEGFCSVLIEKPETQKIIRGMLGHPFPAVQETALRVLSNQTVTQVNPTWFPLLKRSLEQLDESKLPLLLGALKLLKTHPFDSQLKTIADDSSKPLFLRLKALDAMKSLKLTGETLTLIQTIVQDPAASPSARIQAATMLSTAPLDAAQQMALAPVLARVGPVELKELMPLLRKAKNTDIARRFAQEVAKNPSIASQQESLYRTVFSSQPPEIFETILHPALLKANEATEAKKRTLPALAEKVASQGNPNEGKKHFELGKGTCIACHKIGEKGRDLGPNLSKIGSIRTARDLLESILFPSNTLARDYEAHLLELGDGSSLMGVIKSHSAEGLLVMDMAGQMKTVPHTTITANTTLPTSLMPMGLDSTMSPQELLDLVAYLGSLK